MGKEAKYIVRLTEDERQSLRVLLAAKRIAADRNLRARIFLKADLELLVSCPVLVLVSVRYARGIMSGLR
jgi:hypothetical protein